MPEGSGVRGNLRAHFYGAHPVGQISGSRGLGIRWGSAQTPPEINAGVTMPLLDPSPICTITGMFHVNSAAARGCRP